MGDEKSNSVNHTQINPAQYAMAASSAQEPENTIRMDAVGINRPSSSAHKPNSVWGQWLAENGSRMLLFARQQTRTSEDAEDILQDALVKLARKVDEGSFDGGQESWKPFLYTAIRRLAIDLGRKNDRRTKREKKAEADRKAETGGVSDPWFHSDASNDEKRSLLERELRKLPTKFSEVIIMKIWGGHTFAEIGDMVGVSLNTVASRYRYGLALLRKGLDHSRDLNDI